MTQLSIKINDELNDRLLKHMSDTDKNRNEIVREALTDYFNVWDRWGKYQDD